MTTPPVDREALIAEVACDHMPDEPTHECIEGTGWVYARYCGCGWLGEDWPGHVAAEVAKALAARAAAPVEAGLAERLRQAAQHPHKGPNDTDESMLRAAAKRLDGGYDPGGSNTRQTVARVCRAVADELALLRPAPAADGGEVMHYGGHMVGPDPNMPACGATTGKQFNRPDLTTCPDCLLLLNQNGDTP